MSDDTKGTSKDGAEPTGGPQSSAEAGGGDVAAQRAAGGTAPSAGEPERAGAGTTPEGGTRIAPTRERRGMFGVSGSGDTSGFGGLRLPGYVPAPAERPFGGWFDEFADELGAALAERKISRAAIQQVTIDRGEITFYVQRERILELCRTLRDDPGLRFELCSSVSGVDYGADVEQRLHVVYHLLSMTYRRRIRLEVALDIDDPRLPSVVEVYPTADWHERETWDMFGVIFDGHPALTRILMPDDWDGHPQRKDYPLGGIPVEYKGAEVVHMTDIRDDAPVDAYAPERETTEGTIYTVTGGDWDTVGDGEHDDRIVINMGPQHPSTHGVLRLVLELEGETVQQARSVIGYLHTGIEKNCEYRNWTQGVTFVTRADYLAPIFNEVAYCLAVEKLLGVEAPRRATVARVLLMELNRIGSHLVCLATGGMELGALTGMTAGFREREEGLHLLEFLTGLRMNHAYVRPGGLAQDFPEGWAEKVTEYIAVMRSRLPDYDKLLTGQPIWRQRLEKVGYLPVDGCLALGATGPILRSAGLPWDLRKVEPYCGYEEYDFEVPTATEADCYARYRLRVAEMHESLKIIEQAVEKMEPGPVMVADRKIAWPAQLSVGSDGMGNTLEHVRKIMGQSMESLIHHFKLVTEGFRVPPGQVYVPVESPRGELGYHLVSDGGTRPVRVHVRDPSFVNLQTMPAMSEGGMVADVIASVASIDPVMGGVDR